MNPADYLSRHPYAQPIRENAGEAYISFVANHTVPKSMSLDEVRIVTKGTPLLQKLMCAIQSGLLLIGMTLICLIFVRLEMNFQSMMV